MATEEREKELELHSPIKEREKEFIQVYVHWWYRSVTYKVQNIKIDLSANETV